MSYGLAPTAILKKRFDSWFLIRTDTDERLRLSPAAADVIVSLLKGHGLQESAEGFVSELVALGYLVATDEATESLERYCDSDFPLDSLNLLITNRCNLACRHCYVNAGTAGQSLLDGPAWVSIIEQAVKLGAFGINISGGEPLMHPEFDFIAAALASRPWLNANLNTNGTLIDERAVATIGRAFRTVQISLDGPAELHDRLRGKVGSHEQAVAGIRRLIAAGITTNVGFTVTTENLSSLLETVEFCEHLGVDTMNIGVVAPVGRATKGLIEPSRLKKSRASDVFHKELTAVLSVLKDRVGRMKILMPFRDGVSSCQASKHGRRVCGGDDNMAAYILHDGTVTPCDKLPTDEFGVGNAKDEPLAVLWNSPDMKSFKNMTDANQRSCAGCSDFEACGGACPARSFMANGNITGPDPFACAMTQQSRHK